MQGTTKLWGRLVACSSETDLLKDFKTRLQEESQQHLGLTPKYHLTDTNGPAHARSFVVSVSLGERMVASGQGRSKKEAEQAAARTALETIKIKELNPGSKTIREDDQAESH
ncbi:MAG: hypothetical protein HQK55_17115, partial [Deltaproteobacteria bacterium]|nr:hypothetical protein [Deltaproteobacteria bacterium]